MLRGLFLLSILLAPAAGAGPRLTNDDVVALVKVGFHNDIVVQAVQLGTAQFDLSPAALDRLRTAGVRDAVIEAMTADSGPPHIQLLDPGIYFKREDVYALAGTEPVEWQASISPVHAGDRMFTRVDLTGRLDHRSSKLPLRKDGELLIVCEPGRSAFEYLLVRVDVKSDSREFRAQAALRGQELLGVAAAGKSSASPELDQGFDLGVRIMLRLLGSGEYALITPGLIANGRVVPDAEVYTFTVE